MNKTLKFVLAGMLLLTLSIVLLTSCQKRQETEAPFVTNTLPVTPEVTLPEGTLFIRCSEPEENLFSIHLVGAVPTRNIDYAGFSACLVYKDGTKGPLTPKNTTKLYREIVDEERDIHITSEDFGIKDGYMFGLVLDDVPVDVEDLRYEITAFYVIGKEKICTAHQVLSIQDLLNEHILADPKPIPVEETSPLIDTQKWVKQVNEDHDPALGFSDTYYIGASVPDNNGNLTMYMCVALPDPHLYAAGLRYRFRSKNEGEHDMVTSTVRCRVSTLYRTVITETETLTPADFGMENGYLGVVEFHENINTVTRAGMDLEFKYYVSRNATETILFDEVLPFNDLVARCVQNKNAVGLGQYTFIAPRHNWHALEEFQETIPHEGQMLLRVSDAYLDGQRTVFDLQLAAAIPSRFVDRLSFTYTTRDAEGNQIDQKEVALSQVYPCIFRNDQESFITCTDLGLERGYVASMQLVRISYYDTDVTYDIQVHYSVGGVKTMVAHMSVEADVLLSMVNNTEDDPLVSGGSAS